MAKNLKEERLGQERYNNQGCLMKIVEYNNIRNLIVEFQDEYHTRKRGTWQNFQNGAIWNPCYRLGYEAYNNQGCLMKIVEYINADCVIVEFQDEYKYQTKAHWGKFQAGCVYNYYAPNQYGGIMGNKYPMSHTKEYNTWMSMLSRCCDIKIKHKHPAYKDATCCKEWFYYPNFYEWLHNQENFEVWKDMPYSALDKDILVEGNKIYSPDTCCLVPSYINSLVTSKNGNGVKKSIKQVAQEEYDKGTISKKCYEAMMRWEVEITD